MKLESMSGKSRKLTSIIEPYQKRFVEWMVPKIPKQIETYHLTLLTIPLSLLVIIIAKTIPNSSFFLLLHALIILIQYLSDILDGALGRYRNTGLIRWGFYMDHLLDYVFAISVILSYSFFFDINIELTALIIGLVGAFFTHEFVIGNIKGMVNTSGYYGIGPSEVRFGGIIINIFLFITGYKPNEFVILSIVVIFILAFISASWSAQKSFREQDLKAKN